MHVIPNGAKRVNFRSQPHISTSDLRMQLFVLHAVGSNLATTSWLIVIFGELVQSRGILRYHMGLWPLNSVLS
jgi:hypothetical protein